MLVANDGLSAGHVARMVAVARGLARRAHARAVPLRVLFATTSEAHALFADEPFALVTLPAPAAARRAGLGGAERQRLVRGALEGAARSFAPDLFVCDTFPSGPHGELAGLAVGTARRALVRRSVPDAPRDDDTLALGTADFDLAIVADDPTPVDARLSVRAVRVPPITMGEPDGAATRDEARAILGLPRDARTLLVSVGGGGDPDANARADEIAAAVARVADDAVVAIARGPLASDAPSPAAPVRVVRAAPLQPLLAAFDGAFAAAGYNTAHELAKARVPAALFALPRPFDDQAARARRFEEAGFARRLSRVDAPAVADALAWMARAPRPAMACGGADRAADALLDLATGGRP